MCCKNISFNSECFGKLVYRSTQDIIKLFLDLFADILIFASIYSPVLGSLLIEIIWI